MANSREKYLWTLVFGALVALAVPWFLWRSAAVVAGLPVWVWWHVGWLALAAAAFRLFATRAWGLGVEGAGAANGAGAGVGATGPTDGAGAGAETGDPANGVEEGA